MTKARHLQILRDLRTARHLSESMTSKKVRRTSAKYIRRALHSLEAAAFAEQTRLAKRSATTRAAIRAFAPTPKPWCGYFLLGPSNA